MNKRPRAVTIIGWFWRWGGIAGMALALPLAIWFEDLFPKYGIEPVLRLSSTVLFLWMFSSSFLCLLCGNGLLKGRNWARILALAYCVVATLIGAVMYRGNPLNWFSMAGNLVFTVMMWFFLYRPEANGFFRSGGQVASS